MTYLNPIAGALVQTGQVQRQQAVERAQGSRTTPVRPAPGGLSEHGVETADEVILQTREEHAEDQRKKKRRRHEEETKDAEEGGLPEALDVRA